MFYTKPVLTVFSSKWNHMEECQNTQASHLFAFGEVPWLFLTRSYFQDQWKSVPYTLRNAFGPFSVDGDPRYTHADITFFPLVLWTLLPAEKIHGDDCEDLAQIDHPVRLIVVLRRQNAVFSTALVTTSVGTGATFEAESRLYVAIDSGAGWIRDVTVTNRCAALYGSLAKGNVVCRNSKHSA